MRGNIFISTFPMYEHVRVYICEMVRPCVNPLSSGSYSVTCSASRNLGVDNQKWGGGGLLMHCAP